MKYGNYKKRPDLKQRNLDSKLLLYDLNKGSLLELNSSARYIWLNIDNKNMNDLISDYAEHYGIELDIAAKDVAAVIDELVRNEFIAEA
ncbi:MAG TPA: PqqD family protein [Methanotrichaceae archaeon]|nr:PqqD family protein [Methanotrichaceae archaeon]HQF15772.1 PqqD family protein [Methanotrichaceae archaeon]HQI90554.1 PqqD family protein [Methanotrichaceae archaeon]